MTGKDMPSLIDELSAQAMECRELLADVRTATKDLRLAIREALDARDQLDDAVQKMVQTDVDEAVSASVKKLGDSIQASMDAAVKKVGREFDKLANVYMTGDPRGHAADGFDLRRLSAPRPSKETP